MLSHRPEADGPPSPPIGLLWTGGSGSNSSSCDWRLAWQKSWCVPPVPSRYPRALRIQGTLSDICVEKVGAIVVVIVAGLLEIELLVRCGQYRFKPRASRSNPPPHATAPREDCPSSWRIRPCRRCPVPSAGCRPVDEAEPIAPAAARIEHQQANQTLRRIRPSGCGDRLRCAHRPAAEDHRRRIVAVRRTRIACAILSMSAWRMVRS